MLTFKRTITVFITTGALVLGSAGMANARPVIDPPVYWGPGASATHETVCFERAFFWWRTFCVKLPRAPIDSLR